MIRKIFYCVCEYISTNFEFDLKCMVFNAMIETEHS